jgi:hypothetical protein
MAAAVSWDHEEGCYIDYISGEYDKKWKQFVDQYLADHPVKCESNHVIIEHKGYAWGRDCTQPDQILEVPPARGPTCREDEVRQIITKWNNSRSFTLREEADVSRFAREWCKAHPSKPTREQIVTLINRVAGNVAKRWTSRTTQLIEICDDVEKSFKSEIDAICGEDV